MRLACIDAPETAQRPYGEQARRLLQQWLPPGRNVRLRVETTDRFGRTVAEVFTETNLNLAMVEAGEAFAYRQYLARCDASAYLAAEARAAERGIGVWQEPGGITRPWDFRRGGRTWGSTGGSSSPTIRTSPSPTSPSTGGGSSRRYRCREIGSFAQAQQLLRQGHTYLDGDRDGVACESLR